MRIQLEVNKKLPEPEPIKRDRSLCNTDQTDSLTRIQSSAPKCIRSGCNLPASPVPYADRGKFGNTAAQPLLHDEENWFDD